MTRKTWLLIGVPAGAGLLALLLWGLKRAGGDGTGRDEAAFLVNWIGLVANAVMGAAALWAVLAVGEWRNEMRGKTMHDLAMDAVTLGKKIEYALCRSLDRWKAFASNKTRPLGELKEDLATMDELEKEIPPMIARMDAIAGDGTSTALTALSLCLAELWVAITMDKFQRDMPAQAESYEPNATRQRAQAGFHDVETSKKAISDFMRVLAQWGAPFLGTSDGPPPTPAAMKSRIDEIQKTRNEMERAGLLDQVVDANEAPTRVKSDTTEGV